MSAKSTYFVAAILTICCLITGCGREYSYTKIERDDARTGGNLTFVYDETTHTATFGGQGEVIAYYSENPALGTASGNRIGFKIYAPCDINDYSKAKLSFQGSEYTGGSFMQTVYDQRMNYFVLTPVVSEDNRDLKVKISWTNEAKEQEYYIKIADGTIFAKP